MRRSIQIGLILVPVLGAACREAPKPELIPDGIPGSYVYAAKGTTLKKLDWQFAAALNLKPDGTFELALDKSMAGETDTTERTAGTYTVDGDKLWLKGKEDQKGRRKQFPLVIRPDSLIGDIGWKTHLILRGLGAPDPVFVRRHASYGAK
jgi:hypothetical protein